MWVGALISSVLGNILPGAGTLYKSQNLKFLDRAHLGDELSVKVRVRQKLPDNRIVLETFVTRAQWRPHRRRHRRGAGSGPRKSRSTTDKFPSCS